MVLGKRIFFLLFLLLGITASAQRSGLGLPYYEEIPPFFIGYAGPWGNIAQDVENVLYFENEAGIVVFDGSKWSLHPTHGEPTLFQDASSSIYVGSKNFVGTVVIDEKNQRHVRSLIRDTLPSFGRIADLVVCDGIVYFTARGNMYVVRDSSVTQIELDETVERLFVNRNKLYVATNKNTYEYGSSFTPIAVRPIHVIGALRTDEFTMFVTPEGFVKISPDKLVVPFPTEIDSYLRDGDFSCFSKLTNNTICVGTKSHGLFCLDVNGKVIFSLHTKNGFPDDRIQSTFVDRNNNVWVTTYGHVIRVEMNTAVTYFGKYNDLRGSVKCIVRHNGVLYIGTDCGVYRVEQGKCVSVCASQCNALMSYKGKLIAATEEGLKNLSSGQVICRDAMRNMFMFGQYFATISDHSCIIWHEDREKSSSFSVLTQTDIPEIEITSMANDLEQKYVAYCGTMSDGVWMTKSKFRGDSLVSIKLEPCDMLGLPNVSGRIDVYETSLGCVFSTSKGLYRCDSKNSFFFRDGKILVTESDKDLLVTPICEDSERNLWMAFRQNGKYESQVAVAWNTNNSERYTLITAPFSRVRGNHVNVIFPDENSIVWLGADEQLIRLDFNHMAVKKLIGGVRFSQILVNGDSLLSVRSGDLELPYNFRSILFDFVAVEYEGHGKIQYSYYLEGLEKTWSSVGSSTQREYTNLSSGDYVFHVRATHPNGAVSKETAFAFSVSPNPLLSGWAWAFYVLLLSALGYWRIKSLRAKSTKQSNVVAPSSVKTPNYETVSNFDDNIKLDGSVERDDLYVAGKARSMNFEFATVLFSDFKGFTEIAKKISAESLIHELEGYFLEFDKIVEKYNVEKIKTVGDSYMCAGGIPKKNTTNPIEVVAAALEMQYRLKEMQKDQPEGAESWGIRIGVHTGPIIAGFVGEKKYTYDIWGDSVNIASRMEASGEVGRVNVSESTFVMVREFFDCEYRGKVQVQGKEEKADMYFVNGFKTIFSDNPLKVLPNGNFFSKIALLRFEGLQEQVYSMLEEQLPKTYFYHSLKHTIDVVVQVEVIGQAEGISDEDMYILKTAALFHDAGFIKTYSKHEQAGVDLAREMLPQEGYTEEQIEKVCRLIMVTSISATPQDILEQIICDADLDYLGRSDYVCVSRDLYRELLEQRLVKKNEYEWCVGQVKFLQEHKYYTNYSRSQRNMGKMKHIQLLQEQITKFNNIN